MAYQNPSLTGLAEEILKGATTLQEELSKHDLPQPSFVPDGRRNYHDVYLNPVAMDARARLIEAAQTMYTLALGPADALRTIATTERMRVNVLRTIHELGIADAVPANGDISIDDLAAKVGTHPIPLRRVLRLAYTMRVFQEPAGKPDFVAHTPLSALIPAASPWLWLQLADVSQMQASGWQLPWALRNWPRIPLNKSDAAERDFWTIIQQDEPEGRGMSLFTSAMSSYIQMMHGSNSMQVLRGFDWAGLGEGVIVDVGGGSGHISLPVAREFPQLRFVVQDLVKNEGSANELIKAAGLDQDDKVRFQPHDFFTPQPESQVVPKAYLLSRVLHDWPDEDCVRILTHLLPGMKRGAKLFLVERVMPSRPGEVPLHQEEQLRVLDLMMYSILGGCERSRDDWERLLRRADLGLGVRTIAAMPGSEFSAITCEILATQVL
ncbi:O-methyltransferase-domain-containing protein [Echria macrotheca]|uniref:O-methyltransferase-domain-containing protein n=1 Tax=Echria macrotheca TaxID=438768 RepID=A0AAJ0F5W4_9PEZI|nr:O-methyltransferase-domain-containing protein [Echria macrotheca]